VLQRWNIEHLAYNWSRLQTRNKTETRRHARMHKKLDVDVVGFARSWLKRSCSLTFPRSRLAGDYAARTWQWSIRLPGSDINRRKQKNRHCRKKTVGWLALWENQAFGLTDLAFDLVWFSVDTAVGVVRLFLNLHFKKLAVFVDGLFKKATLRALSGYAKQARYTV